MVSLEEKVAYEIGLKAALEEYTQKEASWQAVKTLGSGLKGVATGQGSSVSQAFQRGAGGQGFRQVMGNIGTGLAQPWQQAYQRFGAGRIRDLRSAEGAAINRMRNLEKSTTATRAQLDDAGRAVIDAGERASKAISNFGGRKAYRAAMKRGYIPRNADGTLNYSQLGTMAAGVGLTGAGAYMAGNALSGGSDNYYVQPQQAPHTYYMNKLKGYFS